MDDFFHRSEWIPLDGTYVNNWFYLRSYGYYGGDSPTHTHSSVEMRGHTLHFVLSGKGLLQLGGREFQIGPGDVFYMPPYVPVVYYGINDNDWKYCWFNFFGDGSKAIVKNLGFSVEAPVRHIDCMDSVREIFRGNLSLPPEERQFPAFAAFFTAASLLAKGAPPHPSVPVPDTVSHQMCNIIFAKYADKNFSVGNLSEIMLHNASDLRRIFKRDMGVTPVTYLCHLRLERAAQILRTHDATVKELLEETGFREEAHFMRAFKAHFGKTVRQYRADVVNGTPETTS